MQHGNLIFLQFIRNFIVPQSSKMLKKIGLEWEKKTPKQKAEFIYKIPNYAFLMNGGRVLEDDKRVWYAYSGYITITIYFTIGVYTILYHSICNNSLKFLNAICSSGMAVSVSGSIIVIQLCAKLSIFILFSWLHYICLVWKMENCFVGLSGAE